MSVLDDVGGDFARQQHGIVDRVRAQRGERLLDESSDSDDAFGLGREVAGFIHGASQLPPTRRRWMLRIPHLGARPHRTRLDV
jgi:hypothetical protein